MPESVDIDRLVAELGEVQDELLATPTDDFARRFELNKRQDQLREQVAAFDPDAGRSRAELEAELEALKAQVASIESQRIDLVTQAGFSGTSGEMGNVGGTALNQGIDQAQGRPQLMARIGRIEGRLAEMEGDDPSPV